MSSDVKRLLKKGKLSGKEAARLIAQDMWDEQQTGRGFLSAAERSSIKASIQPAHREEYNRLLGLYDMASLAAIDASRLNLTISTICESMSLPIATYASERRLRAARERLPHVVTAKQYEMMRLAQRDEKLAHPTALSSVIEWYAPEMTGDMSLIAQYSDYDGPKSGIFDYALLDAHRPDVTRPYLEWLLALLESGHLQPVAYTEEAAELAHGYYPAAADYVAIYQQQGEQRARGPEQATEAIRLYLGGELSPEALYDVLYRHHVTGAELYAAEIDAYRAHADSYQPMPPEWPILAILQDEESLEARFLVGQDGLYAREREDKILAPISMYGHLSAAYSEYPGGMAGWLIERKGIIEKRLQELEAFERGLKAASALLDITLLDSIIIDGKRSDDAIERLNSLIAMARSSGQLWDDEPMLPIDVVQPDAIEPDVAVVAVISERMPILPKGWASMPRARADAYHHRQDEQEASYEPQ